MKKLFKLSVLAFACAALFSCEKENASIANVPAEEDIVPVQNRYCTDTVQNMLNCVDNDTVEYYLDGVRVDPGTFDPADRDLYVAINGDSLPDPKVYIRAFTVKNDYFQFGRNNGVPLMEMYYCEKALAEFAETSGAIEEFETTGDVDSEHEYWEEEEEIYNRYLEQSERSPIWLYVSYAGGASTTSVTGVKPFFLSSTYVNTISRYYHFALTLYGVVSVYDKTFFRDKLATVWGWGWQYVHFHSSFGLGFVNDKTESVLAS